MSQSTSLSTRRVYGLKKVCDAWEVARSSYYSRQKEKSVGKRGPKPGISDTELVSLIRQDIKKSPFRGEGHRKVHARLKRKGKRVGRNRILKAMREHQLLSPYRKAYAPPKRHDGKIITDGPNEMWCSDGTKIFTLKDGWVWLFTVEEHWNGECLGYHVCKYGDRFRTLEPVRQAVRHVYGGIGKGLATGVKLRVDNGSQYTSNYFLEQIKHMGIEVSFGLVRQPETNGVVERFNRTLKEQVIKGRDFNTIEELRDVVKKFVEAYNKDWLLQKLGYQSPLEARRAWEQKREVA